MKFGPILNTNYTLLYFVVTILELMSFAMTSNVLKRVQKLVTFEYKMSDVKPIFKMIKLFLKLSKSLWKIRNSLQCIPIFLLSNETDQSHAWWRATQSKSHVIDFFLNASQVSRGVGCMTMKNFFETPVSNKTKNQLIEQLYTCILSWNLFYEL